ncbi:MAG: glutaredoxin family protein [Thermoleophilia bacterium]|nr:glutaredoxin family protein [Thermoleophilia bacterium]
MEHARGAEREHALRRLRTRGSARRRGDHDAGAVPVGSPGVRLYTAVGCHLCERARETLAALREELGFELEEVEITGVAELEERHREWLPVVEIGGERAFVYFVDQEAFRRKLSRARAG